MENLVFWTDCIPHRDAIEYLSHYGSLTGPLLDSCSSLNEADVALVGTSFIGSRELMKEAKRLRIVARFGSGYDSIDLEAATELGICVVTTPDAPTVSVAEFTIAMMLNLSRKLHIARSFQSSLVWDQKLNLQGNDLYGKTLGLIGLGRIGSRVATLASAFGMNVMAFDPFKKIDPVESKTMMIVQSLDDLLTSADFVSLHLPLNDSTRGFIGAQQIAKMKSSAYLLNMSRGGHIDENELVNAIRNKSIRGAALDVLATEPPRRKNPLLSLNEVIITPHIAAYTDEGRSRSNLTAARMVIDIIQGRMPKGIVNPKVWSMRRE